MAKQPVTTAMPKPKPVEILLNEAEPDTLRRAPARSVLFERQCRMLGAGSSHVPRQRPPWAFVVGRDIMQHARPDRRFAHLQRTRMRG